MKKQFQDLNEDKLMQLLAQSDISALAALYQLHAANIFHYAMRMLANPTEADDVVQDVFLKIWGNREKYVPQNHFRAWALRICSNLCLDRKRKSHCRDVTLDGANEPIADENSSMEDDLISREKLERASEAFQSLSYADQQILALRLDGDLSVAETAENLGCSVRTVHYRTAQAIQNLQMASGGNKNE